MKPTHRTLFTLLVLALLLVPTFAVLAKELGQLTISGPGIDDEMTINDPSEIQSLWEAGIIDTNGFVKPPEGLGQGYTITAHMYLDTDALIPVVQMVYYPGEPGQQGYLHIVQRLNTGDTMSPADEWTRMSLSADKALRTVMQAHGVELATAFTAAAAAPAVEAAAEPAADPVSVPASTTAPAPVPATIAWIVIAGVLGAMLFLGRRSLLRRTA